MGISDEFVSGNDLQVSYSDRMKSALLSVMYSSIWIYVIYTLQIILGIVLSILSQDRVIWAFGVKIVLDACILGLELVTSHDSSLKKWLKILAPVSTAIAIVTVGVYYLYYGYGYFGITRQCASHCNSRYPAEILCENTANCSVSEFNDFIHQQRSFDLNTWYCMGFLLSEVILIHLQTGELVEYIALGYYSRI